MTPHNFQHTPHGKHQTSGGRHSLLKQKSPGSLVAYYASLSLNHAFGIGCSLLRICKISYWTTHYLEDISSDFSHIFSFLLTVDCDYVVNSYLGQIES